MIKLLDKGLTWLMSFWAIRPEPDQCRENYAAYFADRCRK